MPSQYLTAKDYVAYGLPTSTTDMQTQQASALVDAYLNRKEGLVYAPDSTGAPCYMAGVEPSSTVNSTGTISPGNNVVVPLSQSSIPFYTDAIGDVVILDRENPALTEACVITAVATGQLTFQSVINSHSSNCTIDYGCVVLEQRQLPAKRSITRTMRSPVRLLSLMGRYGYGRRTDQAAGLYNEVNLLAAIQTFGGPPLWEPVPVNQCGVDLATRELWVPAGILLAYFTEVRVRYVTGYPASGLPQIFKQATANIVNNIQQNPGVALNIKTYKAGQNEITRFGTTGSSVIDEDTQRMLNAYRLSHYF